MNKELKFFEFHGKPALLVDRGIFMEYFDGLIMDNNKSQVKVLDHLIDDLDRHMDLFDEEKAELFCSKKGRPITTFETSDDGVNERLLSEEEISEILGLI